jgi:uncharacterized protein involved in exopolysaccharide biosynthesis
VRSISVRGWQRGQRDDLTLREIRHVLWSRRWLVLGTITVFVTASIIYSLFQERVYTAESTVVVTPQGGTSAGQDTESFLQEVGGAVSTDEALAEAMRRTGWENEASFRQRLEVSQFTRQDSQESGFTVRFSAPEAREAARVANEYAMIFVDRVGDLNDRLAGGTLAAEADVGSRAEVPDHPTSPRPLLYAAFALIAGLAAGGGGALLLDSRTRNWRGARDAEVTLRAPVLGVIPEYSQDGGESQG